MKDLEHPDITAALRTGFPLWKEEEIPHCPICGRACETIYFYDLSIIGCDNCVAFADAYEVPECFEEEKK